MYGADYCRLPEILDDLQQALDAQEKLQKVSQPQMVAGGVRKGLLASRIRIPLKPFPRFLSSTNRRERKANG